MLDSKVGWILKIAKRLLILILEIITFTKISFFSIFTKKVRISTENNRDDVRKKKEDILVY